MRQRAEDFRVTDEWNTSFLQRFFIDRRRGHRVNLVCVCKLYALFDVRIGGLSACSADLADLEGAHINVIQINKIQNAGPEVALLRILNDVHSQTGHPGVAHGMFHHLPAADDKAPGGGLRFLRSQRFQDDFRADASGVAHGNCNQRSHCLFPFFHEMVF